MKSVLASSARSNGTTFRYAELADMLEMVERGTWKPMTPEGDE